MMTLKRFKVTNFRSVMDSGWIDCDSVTSLVGVNEAGKSNIILALWKLNPAREGEIDPLHDMPTKEYTTMRGIPEKITFISAEFELDSSLQKTVAEKGGCTLSDAATVCISRRYNGKYYVSFPSYSLPKSIPMKTLQNVVESTINRLSALNEKTKAEAGIKDIAFATFSKISEYIRGKAELTCQDRNAIMSFFSDNVTKSATSEIYPCVEEAKKEIKNLFKPIETKDPTSDAEIRQLMVDEMPSFVYYSNYGNLDAQIYLPHAIKWLKGEEVAGIKNDAKVRTLRVLFDFVKLNPEEVLELGKDPVQIILEKQGQVNRKPTDEEIALVTEQKTARSILLNSASVDLTRKFKEWWKQGDYTFRLEADGEIFKIWVSDDKRPEPIELERRSTGLQWFLSFFLVFLVESTEAHKGAILLLDEAGLSLHPLAQKDLIAFFENLSKTNQIIHTTHSPFLVDTSNIDRVKVVYVDDDGYTVVSSDLRASDDKVNRKSIYAVHAALGLSVSDILLQGCQPIIVEGPSDQNYLNAIKLYLLRNKKYAPNMELVFMPSGGVRGIPGVVSIVSGKSGDLPIVILDSDQSGKDAKKKLLSGLYHDAHDRIIEITDFIKVENCEIEDLIPINLMQRQLDRFFRDVEDNDIVDYINADQAIIPQIEMFAENNGVILENGWKVILSRSVKQQLIKAQNDSIDKAYSEKWIELFERFNL